MKLFRIYTEDKNREDIRAIVGEYFPGFTMIYVQGVWKGLSETSIIIEISAPAIDVQRVFAAANTIKKHNNQEAVLVTMQKVETFTV